jgi:hypothetical protein
MMSHAQLAQVFFGLSIIYAALVTNTLPLKGLFMKDSLGESRPTTPFELYFGTKPNLLRLRVFGCPVVLKAYQRKPNLNDHNIIQRGVRGTFVSFPINQAGALIWVEQTRNFIVSTDVSYDETFSSPLTYNKTLFADSLPATDPAEPWTPYTSLPPDDEPSPPLISEFHLVDDFGAEGEYKESADSPKQSNLSPNITQECLHDETNLHANFESSTYDNQFLSDNANTQVTTDGSHDTNATQPEADTAIRRSDRIAIRKARGKLTSFANSIINQHSKIFGNGDIAYLANMLAGPVTIFARAKRSKTSITQLEVHG